jgi:CheY-like chemotaxis protein
VRILLAEDNTTTAGALAELLTLAGHAVEVITTGPGVLARLALPPPDAVVLDYVLPGVDGLAVLREMRGRGDGWRAVPVVLTTAAPEAYLAGKLVGADRPVTVLPKPFETEELLRALGGTKP